MAENTTSIFEKLNNVNIGDSAKVKRGKTELTYLPWASAWKIVKKIDPTASFKVHEQVVDDHGTTRPWFQDGTNAWVKVSVTIFDHTETEWLPIMDYANKSVSADSVTSMDANKAVKRCFVKAIALHGLGLYLYEGEDLPEQDKKILEIIANLKKLLREKCSYSEDAKKKVLEYSKEAQRQAFPDLMDEEVTGAIDQIDDEEILNDLKMKVMSIRKVKAKTAQKESK